jgi:hypothetical protein
MAFFGLSFFIQRESSFIVNRNLSVKSLNVGNGLEPGDAEGFQLRHSTGGPVTPGQQRVFLGLVIFIQCFLPARTLKQDLIAEKRTQRYKVMVATIRGRLTFSISKKRV